MVFSCSVFSHQGKHGRSNSSKRDDCDECAIGTASNEVNRTTPCPTCGTGRAPKGTGNVACSNCLAGKFQEKNSDDEIICTNCGAGQYTTSSNAPKCKACDPGEYQDAEGKTACLSCLPGKYGRADAANRIDCDDCKPGTASAESGRKEPCEESDVGTIVLGGGTTAVKVPEGS